MVLTYTIVFYIYQRVFKAHKLNDKKKLTGGPSPTVLCGTSKAQVSGNKVLPP